MFFQTHLGIEMALCAEVWLIGPDIEAWPDRTRFFWCLSNQHCALTYPTHNSTELPLFSVRQYAIHIISTFFIYQITAGCVADDPMESLYIPVDHLLVHYMPLQESTVKISSKNVDWKFDQLDTFWMNTSQTKSWHGHIEPRQDPLQLKLWRGGGGGLVQPVDSQDSNARPSVSLLIQFPMEIHLSAFKTTPCTCME